MHDRMRMIEERVHGTETEQADRESDPLIDRLRQLDWPNVPDELRQRSWERFRSMIAEQPNGAPPEPAGSDGTNAS